MRSVSQRRRRWCCDRCCSRSASGTAAHDNVTLPLPATALTTGTDFGGGGSGIADTVADDLAVRCGGRCLKLIGIPRAVGQAWIDERRRHHADRQLGKLGLAFHLAIDRVPGCARGRLPLDRDASVALRCRHALRWCDRHRTDRERERAVAFLGICGDREGIRRAVGEAVARMRRAGGPGPRASRSRRR